MRRAIEPAKRPDWWAVPREWLPEVNMAPLLDFLPDGRLGVHRSHVPLLAEKHPELRRLLDETIATDDSAELDRKTEQLGWKLRPYQHEGRRYIRSRRGSLLAFSMRSGKTLTVVASHELSEGMLVIVGPLAAKSVWLKELARRWPNEEVLILRDRRYNPAVLAGRKIVFCHYDILPAWQSLGFMAEKIGMLVFDEIHLLSNAATRRLQAALILSSRAKRVVGVTGTPLWNRPAGIWAILACLTPGAFGSRYDFGGRYCDPVVTPYGTQYRGSSNEEEFKLRMTEIMIRKDWREIIADLPPVERVTQIVDLSERQVFDLEIAAERIRKAESRKTRIGEVARLRRLLGEIKLQPTVEQAVRVLEGGEPVVVWTWHRDVAMRIAEAIIAAGYGAHALSGGESVGVREKITAEWRNVPVAALVCTIAVGQVAIDLSHARQAIYAEIDWTPAMVAQSEMRVFSPTRPMAITYVVADHIIDRALVNALQEKCACALAIGVPAADTAVGVIANAFNVHSSDGSLERLLDAILAGPDFTDDDDDSFHKS